MITTGIVATTTAKIATAQTIMQIVSFAEQQVMCVGTLALAGYKCFTSYGKCKDQKKDRETNTDLHQDNPTFIQEIERG